MMPLREPVPDPVTLDLFASAVRLGSLSKAAELHGISQPSATARIRKLESQLGMTLLDRSSTGSRPTPAGSLVAEWASLVRDAMARLIEGSAALRNGGPDPLKVVASYTVAEYVLPGWLALLRREDPEARVELDVANSSEVIDSVVDAKAHIGFVETPVELGGLASEVVGTDRLVLVASPSLPLASEPLGPEEVSRLPLILREPGSGTRETFDRALAEAGAPDAAPIIQLGSTSAIKGALANAVGATALSELAVAEELRRGLLRVIEVEGLDLTRELRAIWQGERPRHELAAKLLDVARHALLTESPPLTESARTRTGTGQPLSTIGS